MFQNRNDIEMKIVLLLLRGRIHLRAIAKELHEAPATIMRRLKEMVKRNIIDFKKEGRNKAYFIKNNMLARNYVLQAEQYKLRILFEKYPEIAIIAEEILKKTFEKIIIFFGSYAKFGAKKDSDIDVYIDTKNRKVKENIEEINSKINVKTGLFDANSPLIKEIIQNHIILRGAEGFYEKIQFFK